MKKLRLVFCIIAVCTFLFSCSSSRQKQGGIVGGVGDVKDAELKDEMLRQQKKEQERHRKELQDIKRQDYYDQKYRQQLK